MFVCDESVGFEAALADARSCQEREEQEWTGGRKAKRLIREFGVRDVKLFPISSMLT